MMAKGVPAAVREAAEVVEAAEAQATIKYKITTQF
jgi:hypothetical protein